MKNVKLEFLLQDQIVADILVRKGTSSITQEEKNKIEKDSYGKKLISKGFLIFKESNLFRKKK